MASSRRASPGEAQKTQTRQRKRRLLILSSLPLRSLNLTHPSTFTREAEMPLICTGYSRQIVKPTLYSEAFNSRFPGVSRPRAQINATWSSLCCKPHCQLKIDAALRACVTPKSSKPPKPWSVTFARNTSSASRDTTTPKEWSRSPWATHIWLITQRRCWALAEGNAFGLSSPLEKYCYSLWITK